MLDTISYSKDGSNNLIKTVTSVVEVADPQSEIEALQAQLAAFESGDQSDEITAAISNYTDQLSYLRGL